VQEADPWCERPHKEPFPERLRRVEHMPGPVRGRDADPGSLPLSGRADYAAEAVFGCLLRHASCSATAKTQNREPGWLDSGHAPKLGVSIQAGRISRRSD